MLKCFIWTCPTIVKGLLLIPPLPPIWNTVSGHHCRAVEWLSSPYLFCFSLAVWSPLQSCCPIFVLRYQQNILLILSFHSCTGIKFWMLWIPMEDWMLWIPMEEWKEVKKTTKGQNWHILLESLWGSGYSRFILSPFPYFRHHSCFGSNLKEK